MTDEQAVREALRAAGNDRAKPFYVQSMADQALALIDSKDAEIARLTKAFGLQMDEKHKEAAEARLWFTKAQQWKARIAELEGVLERVPAALYVLRSMCQTVGLPLGVEVADNMLAVVAATLTKGDTTHER